MQQDPKLDYMNAIYITTFQMCSGLQPKIVRFVSVGKGDTVFDLSQAKVVQVVTIFNFLFEGDLMNQNSTKEFMETQQCWKH